MIGNVPAFSLHMTLDLVLEMNIGEVCEGHSVAEIPGDVAMVAMILLLLLSEHSLLLLSPLS